MEVPIIISDENNKSEISSRKKLKNRLTTGTFALLIALLAVVSATYAWYVYNTGRHTTKVRMAAGAVGEVSEIAPEDISDGEDVGSQEAEEILNDGETSVEQPDSADESSGRNCSSAEKRFYTGFRISSCSGAGRIAFAHFS